MKCALLGHTGLIGRSLSLHNKFDLNFNRTNIKQIQGHYIDTVYCCAPSGNRLAANHNADQDRDNIDMLIGCLQQVSIQRLVLISTVDTQHCADTAYGAHRLLLENFARSIPKHHIIRLSTLIDPGITKNVLYDLKHRQFLGSINLNQCMHWYLLQDLQTHIDIMISHQISETNLVSEPIFVSEIIDRFFPDLGLSQCYESRAYSLVCEHADLLGGSGQYLYSKEHIFNRMEAYLHDHSAQ